MDNKFVSVIIPTYNRAYCLKNAIDSILSQTYPHLELIIVDDGSTDNTTELINSYNDDRLRYLKLDKNAGQSAARNIGLENSKYDLISFHDSDDIWHKDKLEKIVPLFNESDIGFAYHKLSYDLGDNMCLILPDENIPLEKKSGDIYAQLLYDNLVDMPALTLTREAYEKTGKLDESLKCLEDYDYALRLAQNFNAGFYNEILLESTLTSDGVSSRSVDYLTT
nr:glycosyltransferase [Lachnospiraceae bacterium]